MADILKDISPQDDLTVHFNDFFAKEGKRFQDEFKDVDVANAINSVRGLDYKTIKTFITGVLMYLCHITTDKQSIIPLEQLLNTLLQKGININDSICGNTFLHLACYADKINVVKMLLAKGADINAKDIYDDTIVHFACKKGHIDVVKMLLAKGADINAKDSDGNTPLHGACQEGHIEVIKKLLEFPAVLDSLTITNNNGKTPLELAKEINKQEIALLITKAKESMQSKDEKLSLEESGEINESLVNQQMAKNDPNQVLNDELQNNPELTELPVVSHTKDCHLDYLGT